jgi:hypothetical protein
VSLGIHGSRSRCFLVWSTATLSVCPTPLVTHGRASAVVGAAAHGGLARIPLDVALTDLAAALLLVCAAWLWLVTTVVVLEAALGTVGRSRAPRGVPAGVRRVVLAACGVALVGGLAQPSYAGPSHRGLAGLPLPDRAVAPRHAGHVTQPRPPQVRPRERDSVLVVPGDTLWAIAARGLAPGSPDARVATRWHAIYAANRSLIGPDPDVIVPGQRLVLPGKEPS